MVLSQIAGIYDSLGLAIPFTLNAKLPMRKFITLRNSGNIACNWDDPMPDNMRKKMSELFSNLYELENLSYKICGKPSDALGDPMLIIFSNGSSIAYGACVYVK